MARPTEPGVGEPLLAGDHARGADLGRPVGVEEHRAPPVDHLALDVDRAGRAGVPDPGHRAHVVARPHVLREGQQAGEVRGHHHAGLGAVGVDRPQEPLGVEAAEHHDGDARGEQPEARQRAGVVHRADDEVGAELGELVLGQRVDVLGDGLAAGEHRRGQLDALGPAGRARRVHEVGPGRDVGGRLRVGRRGQPRVPRRDALGGLAAPPDHEVEAGLAGRGQPDLRGLGPDEEHPGVGVGQDEGHLVGVEVEVHRHRRRPGQQPAEVREHHLGGVLGEHRHAAGLAEVERIEAVGDPVQTVVDLGPRQGHEIVAQGDLVGTLLGQPRCHQCHRAESNHAPARTRRGRPPGRRPAPERVSVSRPGTRRSCPRRRRSRRSGPANPSPRRTAASRRTRRCRRP